MTSPHEFKTVLVTGANAFYSAAIMDRLVERGTIFHCTVRRESAGEALKNRYGNQAKIFVVPDITVSDAFDVAVRGCDAIFHLASPFKHHFDDARTEFLDPAINGALSALKAASTEPKVKRVVMTSSVAAVINPLHTAGFHRPGYAYTEADWNPITYEMAAPLKAFPPVYTASKGLAEKAAWRYMEEKERTFDLVSINPCHTWGFYTQYVGKASEINMTNSDLSKLVDGEEKDLPKCIMPWIVDIASVADAHINALETPSAKGRYIIANAPLDFQQVVDIMHQNFADADWIGNVPKGNPGTRQLTDFFTLDRSRSERELGLKYGSIEQSVIDFCSQYQEDRKKWAK